MHPFYVIRALGGALFLVGFCLMLYNVYMTIAAGGGDCACRDRAATCSRRNEERHEQLRPDATSHVALRQARAPRDEPDLSRASASSSWCRIGGLVEIVPLFYLKSTLETVQGMRPYTPLELAGRNIYVREGCYLCHSQMIRALRDEVERYGHYSLAAESMYDHPFQWGSKRNGPDLARVGGKYTDAWHVAHLDRPALGRAAVDHADLRVPHVDAARQPRTSVDERRNEPRGRRAL